MIKEEVKKWEAEIDSPTIGEENRSMWPMAREKWFNLEEKSTALARQRVKIK